MARKVTITREVILESALQMLIDEGFASITVYSLAKRIGCSTQPIVWQFENMEGLREALSRYAEEYAAKKAFSRGKDAAEAFRHMGRAYIRMAMKEPNLFRFLYLGERPKSKPYSVKDVASVTEDRVLVVKIAEQTGLTEQQAMRCVQNTILYSHGIATMIATGVFKASEKDVMAMIEYASESFVLKERGN